MKQDYDARLCRILKLHFDPAGGSRYWLEKEKELGFKAVSEIRSTSDLWKFGPMPLEDLEKRPVSDFVPKCFLDAKRPLICAETGGASGAPKATAYFEDEFESVFVDSFLGVAAANGFSGRGSWLWIGPGGPHVIGKAAAAIAKKMSGADAFAIDFDPRWYRRLEAGSVARRRYMDHLLEQALRIWSRERIEYLFGTPVVLRSLVERMDAAARERVLGLHLGGMAIDAAALEELGAAFVNAKILAGYGNTLFGVCNAPVDLRGAEEIGYFPHGDRLCVTVVPEDEDASPETLIRTQVPYGERGRVMFHRLDESCFLPNVLERDSGIRIAGSDCDGVADPGPLKKRAFAVDAGIY